MKKISMSFVFLAFSLGAMAQQRNDDQLQQQPPREAQTEVERAARVDAKKAEADKKQKEAELRDAEIRQKEAELRAEEIKKDEENQAKAKQKTK